MIRKYWPALVLLAFSIPIAAQTSEIREIRTTYNDINRKIAAGDLYLTEINVNKNDASYPAVGTHQKLFRFYFSVGEGGDTLHKVEISSTSAARTYRREYLFGSDGSLKFVFSDDGMTESRLYMKWDKLIRAQFGSRTVNPRQARTAVSAAKRESTDLIRLFALTHDLPHPPLTSP